MHTGRSWLRPPAAALTVANSGGNNQLISYIDYDYDIIITNIIGIKVLIILYLYNHIITWGKKGRK